MASGIVGGTHSKIKGQVGGTIYQIRKNPDGSYSQIEYAKGQQTSSSTTPRLQAQRMCMAMVQSMMKQLKPVACISMQSAPNKSKSLNAFSNNNVRLVANDCKANWYSDNQFVYPEKLTNYADVNDMGGSWLISAGTLQFNVFDDRIFDDYPAIKFDGVPPGTHYFYGVQFNVRLSEMTLREFLEARRMTRLDKVVFCAFRRWVDFVTDPDDPKEYMRHSYIIAKMNPKFPDYVRLNEDNIAELFEFNTNHQVSLLIARDSSCFAFGFLTDYANTDEECYYTAAFSESHLTGRKLISSSTYQSTIDTPGQWLLDHAPADVFGTWIGEPFRVPYPNIFD